MVFHYEPEENVLIAELQEKPQISISLFFLHLISLLCFPTCHIPQLISKHEYVIQVMSSGDFMFQKQESHCSPPPFHALK